MLFNKHLFVFQLNEGSVFREKKIPILITHRFVKFQFLTEFSAMISLFENYVNYHFSGKLFRYKNHTTDVFSHIQKKKNTTYKVLISMH